MARSSAAPFAAALCALAAITLAACRVGAPTKAAPEAAASAHSRGSLPRFPDFGQLPPAGAFQPERVFRLSQDYPASLPPMDPAVSHLLSIDYTRDWKAYMRAGLAYILAGNVENRALQDTFFLEDNPVRRWYHVPWMHWADNGREGLHGLTPEGPIRPFTLSPNQKDVWQTYAVGFYNARGGYEIGRVWADAHNPDLGALTHGGFPPGTVVAKMLFTTTPIAQAPLLSNPIEWTAYIKKTFSFSLTGFPISPRAAAPVRLLQVDMMVRDPRADASGGWVFATWTYNGLQSLPRKPGQTWDDRWNNLVPVGLMWGNDPKVVSHAAGNPTPTRTEVNPELKETVINTDSDLPPMHLGFGLRLNGPADNYLSSCKSCHAISEFPDITPVLPFIGPGDPRGIVCASPQWMLWFRDLPAGQAVDREARSLDNSLSLALSVTNFLAARSMSDGGQSAVQYWKGRPLVSSANQRGAAPPGVNPCAGK